MSSKGGKKKPLKKYSFTITLTHKVKFPSTSYGEIRKTRANCKKELVVWKTFFPLTFFSLVTWNYPICYELWRLNLIKIMLII